MDKYTKLSSRIEVLAHYKKQLERCSPGNRLTANKVSPTHSTENMNMPYHIELEAIQRRCDEQLLEVVNKQILQDTKIIKAVNTLLNENTE